MDGGLAADELYFKYVHEGFLGIFKSLGLDNGQTVRAYGSRDPTTFFRSARPLVASASVIGAGHTFGGPDSFHSNNPLRPLSRTTGSIRSVIDEDIAFIPVLRYKRHSLRRCNFCWGNWSVRSNSISVREPFAEKVIFPPVGRRESPPPENPVWEHSTSLGTCPNPHRSSEDFLQYLDSKGIPRTVVAA